MAHTLLCAASALVRRPEFAQAKTIAMSRDTARMSACATDYFDSRMYVGATPDNVENPDGPTAVSQLEQPCTLPK
jgi:hypothetical protein